MVDYRKFLAPKSDVGSTHPRKKGHRANPAEKTVVKKQLENEFLKIGMLDLLVFK